MLLAHMVSVACLSQELGPPAADQASQGRGKTTFSPAHSVLKTWLRNPCMTEHLHFNQCTPVSAMFVSSSVSLTFFWLPFCGRGQRLYSRVGVQHLFVWAGCHLVTGVFCSLLSPPMLCISSLCLGHHSLQVFILPCSKEASFTYFSFKPWSQGSLPTFSLLGWWGTASCA